MLNYFKTGTDFFFLQEDFYKSFSFQLPWQPEYCMEWKSLNSIEWRQPKDHSCEVW